MLISLLLRLYKIKKFCLHPNYTFVCNPFIYLLNSFCLDTRKEEGWRTVVRKYPPDYYYNFLKFTSKLSFRLSAGRLVCVFHPISLLCLQTHMESWGPRGPNIVISTSVLIAPGRQRGNGANSSEPCWWVLACLSTAAWEQWLCSSASIRGFCLIKKDFWG